MAEKRKILIQLDSDPHPSVFDRVVAIDAGVDELFSYGGVKPDEVGILQLEKQMLHFVYPAKLGTVGSIPLNQSSSVAAYCERPAGAASFSVR